ncbi:hypothetical protein [Bradyrhizobium sp. JYMT SZCCT0428]|uniref:hypothetical protein n=1 Tax=Bradyrhizobium sp. JYMT SZCCT0428 TaxID=2807673 RepID=UPI001BA68000|nr:hypothetical protein [Bradyrhizobium sp. JYMT SZCCT0428]MBR1156637.1 hypothetical protein [Bradyrhizobium sp. JYMT SZCCT0428]
MPTPDELINSIPIGEENAISALEIWKRVSLWSHVTVKEKLRGMAADGLIERKQVSNAGREAAVYFRRR